MWNAQTTKEIDYYSCYCILRKCTYTRCLITKITAVIFCVCTLTIDGRLSEVVTLHVCDAEKGVGIRNCVCHSFGMRFIAFMIYCFKCMLHLFCWKMQIISRMFCVWQFEIHCCQLLVNFFEMSKFIRLGYLCIFVCHIDKLFSRLILGFLR